MIRLLCFLFLYLLNCYFANDFFAIKLTVPLAIIIMARLIFIQSKYLTVDDAFWFTSFIFFVIGPCQSLDHGYFEKGSPASNIIFSDDEFINAMVVLVFFYISFIVAEYYKLGKNFQAPKIYQWFGQFHAAIAP